MFYISSGSLLCTVYFVIILCFTCDVFASPNDEIWSTTDTISDEYGFINSIFFPYGALNTDQLETI